VQDARGRKSALRDCEAIIVKPTRQLWQIAIAFLISIVLNGVLLTIDFSIKPQQEKLSKTESIVVSLLKPAEALTSWLAPGHGGPQILALILFSVAIYAVVAWATLSLPVWWRRRT
jgi:hypothetical protein